MVAEFQFVCMAGKLLAAPKPMRLPDGKPRALLLLANRIKDSKTGELKAGPSFPILVHGRAAESDMPIWTAVRGCGVIIVGKLIRYSSRRGPVTAIDTWWVNITYRPAIGRNLRFARSPSTPAFDRAVEVDEEETFIPESGDSSLFEALLEAGAKSMENEKEHTSALLSEIIANRLMAEGMKSLRTKARVVKRKKTKVCE